MYEKRKQYLNQFSQARKKNLEKHERLFKELDLKLVRHKEQLKVKAQVMHSLALCRLKQEKLLRNTREFSGKYKVGLDDVKSYLKAKKKEQSPTTVSFFVKKKK